MKTIDKIKYILIHKIQFNDERKKFQLVLDEFLLVTRGSPYNTERVVLVIGIFEWPKVSVSYIILDI